MKKELIFILVTLILLSFIGCTSSASISRDFSAKLGFVVEELPLPIYYAKDTGERLTQIKNITHNVSFFTSNGEPYAVTQAMLSSNSFWSHSTPVGLQLYYNNSKVIQRYMLKDVTKFHWELK